jgi:hypothetical protein
MAASLRAAAEFVLTAIAFFGPSGAAVFALDLAFDSRTLFASILSVRHFNASADNFIRGNELPSASERTLSMVSAIVGLHSGSI